MPVDGDALWKVALMLAEVEEMHITIPCVAAASIATTVAGAAGFVLLGPAGILLGTSIAGLGAYAVTRSKFKSVLAILKEDLRPHQQQELIDLLSKAFKDVDHSDFLKLFALLIHNQGLWFQSVELIKEYALRFVMTSMSKNDAKVKTKEPDFQVKYQMFLKEFRNHHGIAGPLSPEEVQEAADFQLPPAASSASPSPSAGHSPASMGTLSSEEMVLFQATPKSTLKTAC